MKKRILTLALALCLCLALLPVSANAAEISDFEFAGGIIPETGGEAIVIGYNGPGGDIVIPDFGARLVSFGFGGGGAPFADRSDITSVTFAESDTLISILGDHTFGNCTGLTSIVFPANVRGVYNNAFSGCTNLTSITFLNGDAEMLGMAYTGFTRGPEVTIYAPPGGKVEAFANRNENTFVPIDGSAPPVPQDPPTNAETPSAWAADSVNSAIANNLVPEALQAKYTQAATRAEFCALAVALYENVMGSEIMGRTEFTDTDDVNVQKAAFISVVNGIGNNRFDPDAGLTREQAATMLARLADAVDSPLAASVPTFADNGSIAAWASDAVGQVQAAGIMDGVGNNTFDPKGDYTREQSIITIMRLFDVVK